MQRLRLYEELAQRLIDFVADTGLKPGDRLPTERELAERLEVSRATVRQATVALEVQGIVEVRHGDGIYLQRTDGAKESIHDLLNRRQRLPEILEARETIECKLAELAARRRTDKDLMAIHAALTYMEDQIAAGEIGTEGDAAFHGAVANAAKNSVLIHLMKEIAPAIHETRVESLSEAGRPPDSLKAHQRIAVAIETGEPRAAAAAMRNHLKAVADVRILRWKPLSEK
ncbi:MAG: FadR/GntR family transcriptional regulator [Acidimicrobiales bacterium]